MIFGYIDASQVESEIGSTQILHQAKLAGFLNRIFQARGENLGRCVFLAKIGLQEQRRDSGMYAQIRTGDGMCRGWAKRS
jgi:hypothetical protein